MVRVRVTAQGRRLVTAAQEARAVAYPSDGWNGCRPAQAVTLTRLLDRMSAERVMDSAGSGADREQAVPVVQSGAACGFPDGCAPTQASRR